MARRAASSGNRAVALLRLLALDRALYLHMTGKRKRAHRAPKKGAAA